MQKGEEWFMTQEDFVCRYLQLADSSTSRDVVQLLSDVADTTKDRLELVQFKGQGHTASIQQKVMLEVTSLAVLGPD